MASSTSTMDRTALTTLRFSLPRSTTSDRYLRLGLLPWSGSGTSSARTMRLARVTKQVKNVKTSSGRDRRGCGQLLVLNVAQVVSIVKSRYNTTEKIENRAGAMHAPSASLPCNAPLQAKLSFLPEQMSYSVRTLSAFDSHTCNAAGIRGKQAIGACPWQ